jgi:putative two-component system response regulator
MAEPPAHAKRLLFIDDSRSQLGLYRRQMEALYLVETAETYEDAMASLSSKRPDLIVVDMVMPRVDGLEFLDILKNSHSFMRIPVIMVSAETDPNIVRQAFLKGAADFVRKPYDEEELHLRVRRLLSEPVRTLNNSERETRVFLTARSLMIKSLADLAATRDNETGFHLNRVEEYVTCLALAVAESKIYREQMGESFLESIGEISVLHDIGKVGIPDKVLMKPGRLTPEEFEIMKTHTTLGAVTIRKIQQTFPEYSFLQMAHQITLSHHEKWDGTGYPHGLKGQEIPLSARLVALVDVFDALTTERIYKPAFSLDVSVGMMVQQRGTSFDPVLFDVFLSCMPKLIEIHGRLRESAD